jgi:pyrimidine and pyridine-specific 5'-nucleotidase
MAQLIDKYFSTHLNLDWEDAVKLHREYYTNYGLAIEGLVRHHEIDPLDYNAKVDDALPLEDIIKPDPELRKLLEDIDTSKVKPWLLTNAYVTHGKRVVRLLGVEDLFEGLTYCDYSAVPFVCKPQPAMYQKAMQEAGIECFEDCYFVGKHVPRPLAQSTTDGNMVQTTPIRTAPKPRIWGGTSPTWSKRDSRFRRGRHHSFKFGT